MMNRMLGESLGVETVAFESLKACEAVNTLVEWNVVIKRSSSSTN